jgi:hypothetical protein
MDQSMTSGTYARDRLDPERLRRITAIFAERESGLGFAAFGLSFVVNQMISTYWHGSRWSVLGLLPLVGAFLAWRIWIPRYYASRFGWVQNKLPVRPTTDIVLLVFLGLLFTSFFVANLLQSVIKVPINFLTLVQSILFLCAILSIAFTARGRAMPARLAIWSVLAGAQGLFAALPFWIPLDPTQFVLWELLNASSWGILITVMGLSNHITMVRLLPKSIHKDDRD